MIRMRVRGYRLAPPSLVHGDWRRLPQHVVRPVWKSDGWGLELVEVLEQSAECDFADS